MASIPFLLYHGSLEHGCDGILYINRALKPASQVLSRGEYHWTVLVMLAIPSTCVCM